jgi:hypothetical protein
MAAVIRRAAARRCTTLVLLAHLAAAPAALAQEPGASREPAPAGGGALGRHVRFNGRALDARQRQTLALVERAIGRLPDGEYWYDPASGAAGTWGGPTLGFLPAGLDLGGAVPPNASGGGQGRLTGVFINGRELHPLDVAGLRQMLGAVSPGRWWLDSQGNFGAEGGPALGNLLLAAQARSAAGQGGGRAWGARMEGATPRDNGVVASDGTTTCVSTGNYSSCTGQ